MTFRPIPGFPNYKINRAGQVYSIKHKKFIKNVSGGLKVYPRWELWNEGVRYRKWAHRLSCEIWVGPVKGKDVHHRDGDCQNYHSDNLVPLTKKEHAEADRKRRLKEMKEKYKKEDAPF